MPDLVIAACALGFFGSLHCIGMCGPIVLSLPLAGLDPGARIRYILLYHAGRASTYALAGALFGTLGMGLRVAGYQQALAIALGLVLGIQLLFPARLSAIWANSKALAWLAQHIKQAFARQFQRHHRPAFFLSGILNGLLPCGLVYSALAGAAATGTIAGGALFMAAFGLATIPALFSISYFSHISPRLRQSLRKTRPVLTGLMAVLLILRGLGLGIPHISPAAAGQAIPMCHTPAPQKIKN